MIRLYQVEWCPYCHRVREALTELGLDYEIVNVPASQPHRSEVIELSGQMRVPIIKDGDLVIADSARIVAYLNETYGARTDAGERAAHRASAAFRTVVETDDPPRMPSAG